MADVSSNLYSWSTTASSNSPSGATNVGSGLDDNLRQLQATVREGLAHYNSVAVASAGTVDLGAQTGNFLIVSGTTTITAFGTVSAGIWKVVRFSGALTLTHNGTSLILPGAANITTVAGDVACFLSEGSGNWRCMWFEPTDGRVRDAAFLIVDNSDPTKKIAFQASGITTATTRTLTVPDASTTIVGTDATQTLTNKTLTSPTLTTPTINTSVAGTAVAGKADLETPTSTAIIVPPAYVQNHPGVAKAWIKFNGSTSATAASHNASLTKNGTGDYTITFATAFSSSDFVAVISHNQVLAGSQAVEQQSSSTTTYRFKTYYENPADNSQAVDPTSVSCVFFGDQ
jgi:hypothetical protein